MVLTFLSIPTLQVASAVAGIYFYLALLIREWGLEEYISIPSSLVVYGFGAWLMCFLWSIPCFLLFYFQVCIYSLIEVFF